jgi:UDP-N-acetylglucosamine 4-epimerase
MFEDSFGRQGKFSKQEEMAPRPLSPYAVGKLTGEYYCTVFSRLYGLSCVALRYFNVFGPRQDPKSMYAGVIPIFVRELLAGRVPTIFGDGEQTRDFTYITNVVQANLKAATASGAAGGVFNAGAGVQTSVNVLYRLIAGILDVDKPPKYGPYRQGDVLRSYADISAARKVLGYQPTTTVEEGLRRTIEWLRKQ